MRHPNHPLTIGTVTLAALLAASCTQDIVPADDAAGRPAPLEVSSLRATGLKEAATRAATTTAYPTGKLVGFFMKADIPNAYAACDNYKGAYDATAGKWAPAPEILLNAHDADIAVYAPFDITQAAPGALALTARLRPADGSRDIWCKRFTASNRSVNLALTLEHVYARLCLTLTRSADYKMDATLADISLTGNEVYAGSTYNLFSATPYAYDGAKGFGASSTQVLSDAHPTVTYDLLLIPTATLTGDLTLAFTVNGKKMRVTVAREKFAGTGNKLAAGKQYNINLRLVPGRLDITSVAIVKWDSPAEVNGGDAEYEPDADVKPEGGIESPDYTPGDNLQNNDPKPV